ncbi:VOC family protein [Salimicrobium sp. PL1-032A]|uniref:VOC family protein n=1 Tax=Salimicrobium sp. PL1-032A TaxID=3095364 RepID=UPI00325FE57B
MNRVNLITLGVRDIGISLRFYRDGLGFRTTVEEERPGIVFFQCNGSKLALYPLEDLQEDVGVNDSGSGFSGITLAYNAKSKEEVDHVLTQAEMAGGVIIKPADYVFWGGYSGYFTDPDGYYWEVAYGADWEFDENDMLVIP